LQGNPPAQAPISLARTSDARVCLVEGNLTAGSLPWSRIRRLARTVAAQPLPRSHHTGAEARVTAGQEDRN
jgi:hypothetical protein